MAMMLHSTILKPGKTINLTEKSADENGKKQNAQLIGYSLLLSAAVIANIFTWQNAQKVHEFKSELARAFNEGVRNFEQKGKKYGIVPTANGRCTDIGLYERLPSSTQDDAPQYKPQALLTTQVCP